MSNFEWPWEYHFPPFFTIQPHAKTNQLQIQTWGDLILKYYKHNKAAIMDVNEDSELFCNTQINRKLPIAGRLEILKELERTCHAAPLQTTTTKSRVPATQWEIYWHTLDEWGSIIYNWVIKNAMVNNICTIFEICNGDNSIGEEFYGLDQTIIVKALKMLETQLKCELIMDDNMEGVKFF